jgi:hypothetical protein
LAQVVTSSIQERVTMLSSTKKFVFGTRATLASAVVLGTLVLSLGISVPSSSASSSKFCTTLLSFESKYASKDAVPPTTFSKYKTWAKTLEPFYATLASEAPNAASKTVLGDVANILKYEGTTSSWTKLEAYESANRAKFLAGTKALTKAIVACY